MPTANCCASIEPSRITTCGFACGKPRSAASNFTCSTATTPATSRCIAASRASSTAAVLSCGLQQELCWESADGVCSKQLGLQPEVCHLNEGHAAFAVLERALSFMNENDQPFEVALAVTRAGNLFTTHTPVAAGFDRFSPALMQLYLDAVRGRTLAHQLRRFDGARPGQSRRCRTNRSTWRTWRFAALARSTASASCTARSADRSFGRCFRAGPSTRFPSAASPTECT